MKTYRLNNGLRVALQSIPTSRSVSFGIWVKAGSRNETEDNNGITHLIEHMLFKGTDKYNALQIAENFDGIGGNINAFTSKEYTSYYTKVLDEHLPLAVEILSSMFFDSTFDETELAKEKKVIFEEISMYRDTPDDHVHDMIAKAAYPDHSLGYTILGTEDVLNTMTSDHIRDYMEQFYTIPNVVLSLAGNVDESVLPLLEKYFGHFNNKRESVAITPPQFHSNTLFQQKSTEQHHICLSFPGVSLVDKSLYPIILLNNRLGGGMSSKLFQEIREKRGLAYSVYSYHSTNLDSGNYTIYMGTAPNQTDEVMKVAFDIISETIENGLSDEEIHRGKQQMKGSIILALESSQSLMNRIGKNELLLHKHETLDNMVKRIESITKEQVNHVIQDHLKQPFSLAMVGDKDKISHLRRDQFAI
ncbi:M16 family metallopeptidase [Longirhabdus pacifica]|uniref:M16 family metallopeptidase n=1 Tax=Longirhabdus pacifica TaxID=2305227 RepID=UPI001008D051|nr:pitrilysin family protein [Longirhabdus pacifica]